MTYEIRIKQRLEQLPPKTAVPFSNLLASGQLSEDALAVILDAGELAGENFRLLGFAVGYLHLRSIGVPVDDVIRMAKSQGRRINLAWGEKRWKHEHDRLSRAETLVRLAEQNVSYDVSRFEALLPKRFDGYLIRSSRRLGMEGLRQRHCVASYHTQLHSGTCAIAAVFVNRQRWTVQLCPRFDDLDPSLRIAQIRSRSNQVPTEKVRDAIHEALGIPIPVGRDTASPPPETGSTYMIILRHVLPVLREHGVERVTAAFDGSCDDGSIHSLYCEPYASEENALSAEIEHPGWKRVFSQGQWLTVAEENIRQSVGDAIEALTDDYLEETGIDWYNDDGGFGELVIDVRRGTVSLDVSVRYTDATNEFCRENDILTGEEV